MLPVLSLEKVWSESSGEKWDERNKGSLKWRGADSSAGSCTDHSHVPGVKGALLYIVSLSLSLTISETATSSTKYKLKKMREPYLRYTMVFLNICAQRHSHLWNECRTLFFLYLYAKSSFTFNLQISRGAFYKRWREKLFAQFAKVIQLYS